MSLITPDYLALNAELHAATKFGSGGYKWAGTVKRFMSRLAAKSLIDYGCGKGTLAQAMHADAPRPFVTNYDPVTFPARPSPADFVACTDVLEHIEPDCLDAVLDDIRALGTKGAFLVISTRPAKKTLSDGRNAHLIVEGAAFWLEKLESRYGRVVQVPHLGGDDELVLVCEA
jgi:2-polyprenyl-3-methyl-5-hydroxy-6-metoxy-1,4-benzoquinol methylase